MLRERCNDTHTVSSVIRGKGGGGSRVSRQRHCNVSRCAVATPLPGRLALASRARPALRLSCVPPGRPALKQRCKYTYPYKGSAILSVYFFDDCGESSRDVASRQQIPAERILARANIYGTVRHPHPYLQPGKCICILFRLQALTQHPSLTLDQIAVWFLWR